MKVFRLSATLACLCLASVTASYAATVTVANPSFEDQVLADGAGTFSSSGTAAISSWLIVNSGGGGGVGNPEPTNPGFPGGTAPDGKNYAYLEAATVSQILTSKLTAGRYTLSLFLGNPADRTDTADPASFDLYLPGAGRTVASSGPITLGAIPNGTFVKFTASGSVAAGDADIGKALQIRVHAGYPFYNPGPYYAFDDIRLDVTPVPEPGEWALLSGGLVLLVATRRRQSAGS